jgi:amidase
MNKTLHYLELLELAELLRNREITSVTVTEAQLERIAQLDPDLASYALVCAAEALASASAADAEIGAGKYRGPLHGVPIGVKDVLFTKGIRTSGGMPIYGDFYPAEDATAVARLRAAGAVILGKLQMTEGAYSDHHPSVVPPRNPWNPAYWTGISSSGPAAATAAGMCYGSLASDTGGSIRWPCAAMGLTGIKPTWGRVSRFGVFDLAPTMDHVGAIARTAADTAALLGVIAGYDPKDLTTLPDPVPDYSVPGDIRGLRIGIDPKWNDEDVDASVCEVLRATADRFKELGALPVEVAIPNVDQTIVDWSMLCAVEAALAHEQTYPARKDEYGPVLASVLEAGHSISAMEFQRCVRRRIELRAQFAELFRQIDVLLTPAQAFAPLSLEAIQTLGEQPELILRLQRFTAPFDMSGDPTITLPGGFNESCLPIAFQLIAGRLGELQLIRAARAFQGATDWHKRHPSRRLMPLPESGHQAVPRQ